MKYIIASDIHGSAKATRQIVALANKENADKIILLGDIYNHGPRNILPEEYAIYRSELSASHPAFKMLANNLLTEKRRYYDVTKKYSGFLGNLRCVLKRKL